MLFVIPNCFSQQNTIAIKGIVRSDSLNVSGITILNKTTKKWTITNDDGFFEISARLADTLMVSAVHINDVELVVNKKDLDKGEIYVPLEEFMNQMETIVLNNLLSTYAVDFSAAFKPRTNPDPEKMRLDEIQRFAETDPLKRNGGANLLGGLALLAKLFKHKEQPRELSRTEKLVRWEEFKIDFIDEFGFSFFTEDIQIPEILIDEFLLFCKRTKNLPEMYTNNDKLSLLDFFVKKSKEYKSLKKL